MKSSCHIVVIYRTGIRNDSNVMHEHSGRSIPKQHKFILEIVTEALCLASFKLEPCDVALLLNFSPQPCMSYAWKKNVPCVCTMVNGRKGVLPGNLFPGLLTILILLYVPYLPTHLPMLPFSPLPISIPPYLKSFFPTVQSTYNTPHMSLYVHTSIYRK